MKDRFTPSHAHRMPRSEQQAWSDGGGVIKRVNLSGNRKLRDHRSCDPPLADLDDLEEQ